MPKDIFGSQDTRLGAHVTTQNEWNGINNSLTNIVMGDNTFNPPSVDADGAMLTADTFFFPHIAGVDFDYVKAIVGPQREEAYYPFVDYMAVYRRVEEWIFTLVDGQYIKYDAVSTISNATTVLFNEPNAVSPATPVDNVDGAIIGYEWSLVPSVIDVTISGITMTVQFEWVAGSVFENDAQAQMYTKDAGVVTSAWAPSAAAINVGTYDGETMINTWLQANDPSEYPIDIDAASEAILDGALGDVLLLVPVARLDWDVTQTVLERCVQLLFGSQTATLGGSGGGQLVAQEFKHPFRGKIKDGYPLVVQVGIDRPDFKDSITIEDPDTDVPYALTYGTVQEITLDAYSYYVYYDCYKNGTVWESTLKKSTTWPPTVNTGNVLVLIGYAPYASGVHTWQQYQFECPRETVQAIRGEFEPWYADDGSVTIAAGTVDTFNGDTGTVAEKTFVLSSATEIWVKIVSTASATTPSVSVTTALQNGTFPGMYTSDSDSVKNFHYKIGEVVGGIYEPSHKGRLHIDNTLLTPLITTDYERLTNTPRMMAFHTDQPILVGDNANDDLLYGEFLDLQVRGGGVQQMVESTEVRIYGKTVDTSMLTPTFAGVNGTGAGNGSFSVKNHRLTYETDKGVVQVLANVEEDALLVDAGDNVEITYLPLVDTATINVPTTSITVITDMKLDGSNNLQIKTRTIQAIDPSAESAWTTVTDWTTTACT